MGAQKTARDERPAILVASFGTTHAESRHVTIGAVEADIREVFPDHDVRRAFLSNTVINTMRERDGRYVDTVSQAMERLAAEGVRRIVVQPTCLAYGKEHRTFMAAVDASRGLFDAVEVGEPLLASDNDYARVARAFAASLEGRAGADACVVFVGHGMREGGNDAYRKMQEVLRAQGHANYLAATILGHPSFEDVVQAVRQGGWTRAILHIFMLVSGDHAANDMAGAGEDSLRGMLAATGVSVECVCRGLGEIAAIDDIFVEHARVALARLEGAARA